MILVIVDSIAVAGLSCSGYAKLAGLCLSINVLSVFKQAAVMGFLGDDINGCDFVFIRSHKIRLIDDYILFNIVYSKDIKTGKLKNIVMFYQWD